MRYRRLKPTIVSLMAVDTPVFGPDVTKDPVVPKNGFLGVGVMPGTQMLLAWQNNPVLGTPAF